MVVQELPGQDSNNNIKTQDTVEPEAPFTELVNASKDCPSGAGELPSFQQPRNASEEAHSPAWRDIWNALSGKTQWQKPIELHSYNHDSHGSYDLERAKDFYMRVLGFQSTPRPDLEVQGYWVVHAQAAYQFHLIGVSSIRPLLLCSTGLSSLYSNNPLSMLLAGVDPITYSIFYSYSFSCSMNRHLSEVWRRMKASVLTMTTSRFMWRTWKSVPGSW